eukprot:SAG31_NODE_4571_length_3127_cov_2.761229_1_plen_200_part_00
MYESSSAVSIDLSMEKFNHGAFDSVKLTLRQGQWLDQQCSAACVCCQSEALPAAVARHFRLHVLYLCPFGGHPGCSLVLRLRGLGLGVRRRVRGRTPLISPRSLRAPLRPASLLLLRLALLRHLALASTRRPSSSQPAPAGGLSPPGLSAPLAGASCARAGRGGAGGRGEGWSRLVMELIIATLEHTISAVATTVSGYE